MKDLQSIDWHAINTTDFRLNNSDGDYDRIRKKHAEFLVKDYLPSSLLQLILVYNETAKARVDMICKKSNFAVEIAVATKNKYYF